MRYKIYFKSGITKNILAHKTNPMELLIEIEKAIKDGKEFLRGTRN